MNDADGGKVATLAKKERLANAVLVRTEVLVNPIRLAGNELRVITVICGERGCNWVAAAAGHTNVVLHIWPRKKSCSTWKLFPFTRMKQSSGK